MMGNNDKFAVTICRQFCSGGLEIGKALAQRLDVKYYDKELITLAAKESGFTESTFEKADEVAANSFLYSVVMGGYPVNSLFSPTSNMVTNDSLFTIQSKIIKDISEKESCVIIGRCSDYILREHPHVLRIFLRADMEDRIERFKNTYDASKEKNLEQTMIKADKKRSNYYGYYTGNEWDNINNYDLVINTSKFSVDRVVDHIVECLNDIK